MPIPKGEADKILKKLKWRYGGPLVNPSVDSDYEHVDVFSTELPIFTKKEFGIAESIGKKHDLKLIFEDFSVGEGLQPEYEPVYVMMCSSLKELKEALQKMDSALGELSEKVRKLRG